MSKLVLIIGEELEFEQIAKAAFRDTEADIHSTSDLASAKRSMLQAIPVLVFCSITIGSDQQAGLRFCRQVADHASLSKVPVVLLTKQLNEELKKAALLSAAKKIILSSITWETLREEIRSIVPDICPPPVHALANEEPEVEPVEVELDGNARFEHAQKLLATVLHNLKTSDLLQIVEIEDVPRVVYEITKSVCGIKGPPKPEVQKPKPPEIILDLNKAFNLKK